MNSKQVKEAFAAFGFKVRVRDLGQKFRICADTNVRDSIGLSYKRVASDLGGQEKQNERIR